jgi:glycolate oxidase FAD binding subunit
MNPLWDKLRGLLGAEYVPEIVPADYTVDGVLPRALVQPRSQEGVARFVEWAHGHFHHLIPRGGGTAMAVGNIPRNHEITLSLTRLNRIVEYTPEDMTVTVEAGLTLVELQQHLAQHGQFLPVEAPPRATIGGIIACNTYGPSRLAWGLIRDWLIGIRFVRGDGKLIHGGGKVVKNVAGYDLCKLLVGSHGTIGIIVEATFKVAPLPAARFFCVTNLQHLPMINASPVRLQFVELLNPPACHDFGVQAQGADTLLVGVSGTREEVEWQANQLATKQIELDPCSLTRFGENEAVLLRFVGQQSEFNQLRKQLVETFDTRLKMVAHANLCVVRCTVPASPTLPEIIQRFRTRFQVRVERAPVELKKPLDVWGDPGTSLPLMKKLKQELDPRGILSPGRFVGGI